MRDINGTWQALQDNGFVVNVTVHFVKPDGTFAVTADHSNGRVKGSGFGAVGTLIAADEIQMRIGWDNQTEGAYNGVFGQDGVIRGSTFDVKHPEVHAGWKSSRQFL